LYKTYRSKGEIFDTEGSEKAAGITAIYAQPASHAVAMDGYAFQHSLQLGHCLNKKYDAHTFKAMMVS